MERVYSYNPGAHMGHSVHQPLTVSSSANMQQSTDSVLHHTNVHWNKQIIHDVLTLFLEFLRCLHLLDWEMVDKINPAVNNDTNPSTAANLSWMHLSMSNTEILLKWRKHFTQSNNIYVRFSLWTNYCVHFANLSFQKNVCFQCSDQGRTMA